jgi:GNAT superfamily N-acetyltransferase
VIVDYSTWSTAPGTAWRPARAADGPALAELRATVLRPSLERLGRYDETRVRERFLAGFAPENTHVLAGGEVLGSIALRPADDGCWVEHFYLAPAAQGGGLGTSVLTGVVAAADAAGTVLRLDVLQRSDARRLYERHGFVHEREDAVDVWMRRDPRPTRDGPNSLT